MIATVSEAMQTEMIGGAAAISVALIGAAAQLRKLRQENKTQHGEGQQIVADGLAEIRDRLDKGDRRMSHIEDELAELRDRRWWRRRR